MQKYQNSQENLSKKGGRKDALHRQDSAYI